MAVYTPRRGTVAEMILAVKQANPDLSAKEVQQVVSLRHPAQSVSLSHVQRTLDLGKIRPRIRRIPVKQGIKNPNVKYIEERFKDFLDEVFG